MKIIKEIIAKMDDTLEEIEYYGKEAHHLRNEHKAIADKFIEIADVHINVYNTLHKGVVMLIEEERKKGVEVPKEMQIIWDYEHKKLIEEFNEAKFLVDEYKKLGY